MLFITFICLSCEKEKKVDKLSFEVYTEKVEYAVGESVKFKFSGSADVISMFSGEDGKKYNEGDYAIAVKGVADKISDYQYTFTKPGVYLVVFKAKNQNVHGNEEILKELRLKIVGATIPGVISAIDFDDNVGGTINVNLDSEGNQTVENLIAGNYVAFNTKLIEKGSVLFELLSRFDQNSTIKASLIRDGQELFSTNITANQSNGNFLKLSGNQISPVIDTGAVIVKLEVLSGTISIKNINVTILKGTPLPGKFLAKDFVSNQGGRLENSTAVEGGVFLGGIATNDYFLYDVNVLEEGTYKINYRITANRVCTLKISAIEQSGISNVLETKEFPSTGGWSHWTTIQGSNFYLTKGRKRIKIDVSANGMSLSSFEFVKVP